MTRTARALLIGALLMTPACGPKTIAPPVAASWELRGSVETVSASTLEVRHKSGRIVPVDIDGATEFVGNGGRDVRGTAAAGMRVTVRVETRTSGGYRACMVRVFD